MNTDGHGSGNSWLLPVSVFICVHLWFIPGCASDKQQPTTRPSSMSQRQEDALRDPFSYKPDTSRDISGGGIGDLDREGLKRDLNNVFNP